MIVGVTGLLGAGKTAYATYRTIALARRTGAYLASNIRLVPPDGVDFVQLPTGTDGVDLEALYALRARCRAEGRGLVLLLDEVGLLLPARFWASFPVPLMSFFVNSRKLHVDIWWVSQDEADVESSLRRRTQYVYKVRRLPPARHHVSEPGRPWLLYVTRWLSGQVEKRDKRVGWEVVRWRRDWESWFDTDELVEPPARVMGRGGRRSRGELANAPAATAAGAADG